MDNTLHKIISVFHSLPVFTRFLEAEKYSLEVRNRYQYGGQVVTVTKNGIKVHEKINYNTVGNAVIGGYDAIMDEFLKEKEIDWTVISGGRSAIDIGIASMNISGPWDYGKQESKEESEIEKRIENFKLHWNRMVVAVGKYL